MSAAPLFRQLFGVSAGVTVALLIPLGVYAGYEARQAYLETKRAELEAVARVCQGRIGPALRRQAFDEVQSACEEAGRAAGMRITAILPDGKVVGDSDEVPYYMENHADRPEIQEAFAQGTGYSRRYSATLRRDLMYVAVAASHDDEAIGVVRASFPIAGLAQTLARTYGHIAAAGVLAAIVAAGASWTLARRIARPVESVRAGAEQFAAGNLAHRLPIRGAFELQRLAETMNHMAEQLHQRMETIARQQREHQAVLANMEEGVMAVDHDGVILSMNETCASLLGADFQRVRGRLVHEVARSAGFLQFVERALAGPEPIESDVDLNGPDGRSLRVHGTTLLDAQDRRIGVLLVVRDVSWVRHLENVRRDFVANVSHELRTPITSIKGFVETLLHEELEDRDSSLRFLRIVLKQVNRLDAIIQDLLMLSRVERGAEEQSIALAAEPLVGILRSAVEMCEHKAGEKQIALELLCPDDLAAKVNAPLLEQAMVNLIDNAVKYSNPGGTVWIVAETHDEGGVLVRVEDEGCGIEASHLPRLFERFYRVDRARSRELGGTGLGLAIVKHIVAAHRGSVRVDSTVGEGSTFYIHLPANGPVMSS